MPQKIKLKISNIYRFIEVVNFHYLCTANIILQFFFFYQIILKIIINIHNMPNVYNCRRAVYSYRFY